MLATKIRPTLFDLCQTRGSVFASSKADTIAEIGDLERLDAAAFFAETHITEGMKILLRQVFERLMGRSEQGVFRLKQAMGGGKTHNLLAAALLAKDPAQRTTVLKPLGIDTDARLIRVAAFSGRETDSKDYLWVTLFRALGVEGRWQASSEVPGAQTWARVIGQEPALILLDELPPFFVGLGGKSAGPSTTEADRLALALANLMTAIINGGLPNCCLVISDLAGAWEAGGARIQQAIDNATKEISRGAYDITPVRLDSVELYAILRARLFEIVPDQGVRREIGQDYEAAYRTAIQQGVMPGSYERWARDIGESYPFHPGLHELFARFRENPNFQQTREMLRLARRMVARLWDSGAAKDVRLIHPHELDLADQDVASTLQRINPHLENARSRDVARMDDGAIAQNITRELADPTAADAAKLLYLASLAIGPNALQGMTPEEAAAYLCAPGRDVSSANVGLFTRLEEESWYLHRRTDGRWHYRDVKNVTSAIRERAELMNEDARRKEVENHLKSSFDPNGMTQQRPNERRWAYQRLLVFPSIEDIQEAAKADDTLLVIGRPSASGLNPDLKKLWENLTFQNRILFLCGSETFTEISRAAAYKKAAQAQVAEFEAQKMGDGAPEMGQARAALDRHMNAFLSALRETFTQLHFPGLSGKLEAASLKLDFASNSFVGQLQILDTLTDQRKFRDDVEADGFRGEFEAFIFTTPQARWADLKEATARRAEWYFVPPGGHESMKSVTITKDVWRDEGAGYLRKGPFPKDKTDVTVTRVHRDDATGKAILQVVPRHGDRVHYEEGGAAATVNAPLVQNGRLETDAVRVSFLAVDGKGEHETGDPVAWQNQIVVKHKISYRDGQRWIELRAIPRGTIRYTLDGSNPRNGGVYGGEFTLPAGATMLQAYAECEGVEAEPFNPVPLPKDGIAGGCDRPFRPQANRPATWRRRLQTHDRRRTFEILASLQRLRGGVAGTEVYVSDAADSSRWVQSSAGEGMVWPAARLEERVLDMIKELGGDEGAAQVSLTITCTRFDSGTALEEAAKELNEEVAADEVQQ